MRAGGVPGNPGGLVVSIVKTAGARAPAHQARGRGRRTWRPTERTAGARMVPPGEGNDARGNGRRGVGVSQSTAEAGELSPRDPVEGRGHRQVAPLEGKTANTPPSSRVACGLGGEYDARARFRVRPGVVVMEQNTKLSADVWQRRRVNSPLCASKLDGTSERCSRRTQPVSRATREEDTPIERRVVGGQEFHVVDPPA